MSFEDHETTNEAAAMVAKRLGEADELETNLEQQAKEMKSTGVQLQVAQEQRAYFERATEELLKSCIASGGSIKHAMNIPVPDSIEVTVGDLETSHAALAPEDDEPAAGSNGSSPPDFAEAPS